MLIQGLSASPQIGRRFRACLCAWRPQPRWIKCKRWYNKTIFTLSTFLQFYLAYEIIVHMMLYQIVQYFILSQLEWREDILSERYTYDA